MFNKLFLIILNYNLYHTVYTQIIHLLVYNSGCVYNSIISILNSFYWNLFFNLFFISPGLKVLTFFSAIYALKFKSNFIGFDWLNLKTFIFNITVIFDLKLGLISTHPTLLYITLITLYFVHNLQLNNIILINTKILVIISTITFILGGSWGWLNGSWSYYWVYDYIEYFLINLIVFNLLKLHTKSHHYLKNYVYLYIIYLFLLFWLLRLNFLITRHASFSKIKPQTKVIIVIFLLIWENYKNFTSFVLILSLIIKLNFSWFLKIIIYNFLNFFIIFEILFLNMKLLLMHLFIFYIFFFNLIHVTNYFFYFKFNLNQYFCNFKQIYTNTLNNKKLYLKENGLINKIKLNFNYDKQHCSEEYYVSYNTQKKITTIKHIKNQYNNLNILDFSYCYNYLVNFLNWTVNFLKIAVQPSNYIFLFFFKNVWIIFFKKS